MLPPVKVAVVDDAGGSLGGAGGAVGALDVVHDPVETDLVKLPSCDVVRINVSESDDVTPERELDVGGHSPVTWCPAIRTSTWRATL